MIKVPNRIITLEEARSLRQSWYFNGRPCVYGHISTRNLHNSSCHECKRKKSAGEQPAKQVNERQRRKEFHERWLREHREKRAQRLAEQRRKRELDLAEYLLS